MRRKGFTMIEMLTVTVILIVMAAIVLGRLQNDRDSLTFQKGIQSIESAAHKAQNEAISTGKTFELTFDESTQSLKVAQSDPDSTSPVNSTTGNSANSSNDTNQGESTSSLGNAWAVYQVKSADGTTSQELNIKFYADGTAENKTVEFHSGDAPITLRVRQNGTIEVTRGAMPADEKPDEWEAGNLEQRTTG